MFKFLTQNIKRNKKLKTSINVEFILITLNKSKSITNNLLKKM